MPNESRSGGAEERLRRESQDVIRRSREQLKLSQGEFARSLGEHLGHPVSQSQISDWERGRFEPGATILLAVAELAHRSVDELRSAGPPALMDRVAGLEDRLERLGDALGSDPDIGEEQRRVGRLLAQIIEVLDHAGLWPSDGAKAAHERDVERGRARAE